MSNDSNKRFPVRFVKANKGVQSEQRIDGRRGFPHKDGVQPAEGASHMCSIAFAPPAKPFLFLTVHEAITQGDAHDPRGDILPSDFVGVRADVVANVGALAAFAPSAPVAADVVVQAVSQATPVVDGSATIGKGVTLAAMLLAEARAKETVAIPPVVDQQAQAAASRHQHGDGSNASGHAGHDNPGGGQKQGRKNRKDRGQQGRRDDGNRTDAPRTGTPGSRQKAVDNRPARHYTSAAPAAPVVVIKPATAADALNRMQRLLAPAPKSVGMSDLKFVFGQRKAETDVHCIAIRGGFGNIEEQLAALDAQRQEPAALIDGLNPTSREKLAAYVAARATQADIEKRAVELNADRLRYQGKLRRVKTLTEKQSEIPADLSAETLAAIKVELDARGAALKEQKPAHKPVLENADYDFLWDVGGLMSTVDAVEERDRYFNAATLLAETDSKRQSLLNDLASLVNDYEKRLSELA